MSEPQGRRQQRLGMKTRGRSCVVCDRTTFREQLGGEWPRLFGREIPVCPDHIDEPLTAEQVAAALMKVFA